MAPPGDIYERELKYLLSGDPKVIAKMVKTCDDTEAEAYNSMLREPFLVVRAAGSLGVDLVALRWDFSFPIEVKSSNESTMHFSRNTRLTEQADQMLQECQKSHLIPIYAYRLKGVRGDPWRVFTIPSETPLRGRCGLLNRRIPKMDVSNNGNLIMRWDSGMKLSDFISYMCMSDYEKD
jgi:Holliday junction resolvase